MKKIIVLLFSFCTASANAVPIEHITNGGFETGDFSGWNNVNTGSGNWQINDGSFVPPGPNGAVSPISGSFDAVSFQGGPGFHNLFQDILLPTIFDTAFLSWNDRIRNNTTFSDPNQEWRVLIEDLTGALIGEVFSTNVGDTNSLGPNSRRFDLTSLLTPLAGKSIRVSFEQQDNLGYFNATLDNVSFTTATSVPEPSSIALLGLGLAGIGFSRKKKA